MINHGCFRVFLKIYGCFRVNMSCFGGNHLEPYPNGLEGHVANCVHHGLSFKIKNEQHV